MKLLYHPIIREHLTPEDCPEQPRRLETLLAVPWLSEEVEHALHGEPQKDFLLAQNGEQYLELVHTREYIRRLKEDCSRLRHQEFTALDEEKETWLSQRSYEAACFAVGAAVQAAELAKNGEPAFALVRPPGHHAFPNRSHGYCLFNNVAIATEYLRRQGERVMIVDIDLHLGDGTLAYVEDKKDIFYFSLNQEEEWPQTRLTSRDNTRIVFLPEGTAEDTYISILREYLRTELRRFSPSMIAVSAGFDTYKTDYDNEKLRESMGGFKLTSRSTKELITMIKEAGRPYFAVLEGGYDPLSVLAGVLSFVDKDEG